MNLPSIKLRHIVLAAFFHSFSQSSAFGAELVTPAANATANTEDAARARVLLNRAVAHYKESGDHQVGDFGSKGRFVDGELYVYVVSTAGVLLASGGPSASVIGQDVSKRRDALGKLFFRDLLAKARGGDSGQFEYRWLNPVDNKVELKIGHFQKVGDRIIVVGHYVARATPEQAQALLIRAVNAMHSDHAKAVNAFNTLRGPYAEDDLYVFVVDLSNNHFLANGANPGLIGTDALSLRDPNGKAFAQDMITSAANYGRGEVDYAWPNPVSGNVESKHTYFRRVDNTLVGVGYYAR
jgi:cytochrome c